jgi:hypothetical protein
VSARAAKAANAKERNETKREMSAKKRASFLLSHQVAPLREGGSVLEALALQAAPHEADGEAAAQLARANERMSE